MIDLNLSPEEESRVSKLAAETFHQSETLSALTKRLEDEFSWDVYRAIDVGGFMLHRVRMETLLESCREVGYASKEWRTGVLGPCPACAKNDGKVLGLDDVFPSGDKIPPAHGGCRCVILPVHP